MFLILRASEKPEESQARRLEESAASDPDEVFGMVRRFVPQEDETSRSGNSVTASYNI